MPFEQQPATELSPADLWVYLDTDVLRYILDAIEGWTPPPTPSRQDRERIAAMRVFMYGYRDRCGWWLVTSTEAETELMRRDAWNRIESRFFNVDLARDAPSSDYVDALASGYEHGGLGHADARHLARTVTRPWFRYLVTNDAKFRKRATKLGLPEHLAMISPVEAEALLAIGDDEHPPISLTPSPSRTPWWIKSAPEAAP